MGELGEFLDVLAADPRLREEFAAAPAAVLTRAGVDVTGLAIPERMELRELEARLGALAEVRGRAPATPEAARAAPPADGRHQPVWSGARTPASTMQPEAAPERRRLRAGHPLPGVRCPARLARRTGDAPATTTATAEAARAADGAPAKVLRLEEARPRAEAAQSTSVAESAPVTAAADGPLPGAWFATHGTAVSRALSVQPQGMAMVAEAVFGQDDRERIPDASAAPYHWLCALVITAANGSRWFGTGWLAAPRLVITAGHCVFMPTQGGWVSEVMVLPGRNGPTAAPRIPAAQLHSVEGWVTRGQPECDYGAIVLPEGALAPDWGYFGYGALGDDDLLESLINVVGYPIDKDQGTLWAQVNTLLSLSSDLLVYENDTYGGMSGCPVIRWDGADFIAVGIHNYGDLAGNRATRINRQVFDNINFWKTF